MFKPKRGITRRGERRLWLIATLLVAVVCAACGASAGGYNYQSALGTLSNEIAQPLENAVPYPQSQMNTAFPAELANDRERLLRQNQPDKVGYVYIEGLTGKPVGFYSIVGPVTSTQSQMTETDQINGCGDSSGCVTASIGDDGSFGPEEGGPNGIFFFTTSGVMVETDLSFIYSDAPLPLSVPSLNPVKAASSESSFWKAQHPHK